MAVKTYTKGQKIQLSKNFTSLEFDCQGNGCCSSTKVDSKLVDYLQQIRNHFGEAVSINSGYRCPKHNANIGGAPKSNHMNGEAADIRVKGKTPIEIARVAEKLGILGIGVYSWGIHIDTRTTKYFWYDGGASNVKTFQDSKNPVTIKPTSQKEVKPDTPSSKPVVAQPDIIWKFLKAQGFNDYGVAGLMGNLYAESGLIPNNLENTYSTRFRLTDVQYTQKVDNGSYTNFAKDGAGYGLAQWTYWTRKQNLLNFAKSKNKSIADLEMQLEFLVKELKENYTNSVYMILKNAKTILEASNAVLLKFERPANQSIAVQAQRAALGKKYYDQYGANNKNTVQSGEEDVALPVNIGNIGNTVKEIQKMLIQLGYTLTDNPNSANKGVDNIFGSLTHKAVCDFQSKNNLKADGIVDKITWTALKKAINKQTVKVTANILNVRDNPGIENKIIGNLRKNTLCDILEIDNNWGRIANPEGWICMDYVIKI